MQRPDRLRVALVAPTLRLPGGHGVQAARLLDAWRDDPEVELQLVPINPAPALLTPLLAIKYLRTALTQFCYWPSLVRHLRNADVVHVFSPSNTSFFLSTFPVLLVGRLRGTPIVVNYRGDGREHLATSPTVRRWLRTADVIAVPSVYFERIFAEFGMASQIVPNIADLSRFRFRVRDRLRPRLLSTRHFEPIYNVSCTVRAFARVRARYPGATLTLVGTGSEEAALRRLVATLHLSGVTFTGALSQAAISELYDAADIYVQTPIVDNMPASLIEAFASGLPVVATRVGGVPALLEHRVHGLLAQSDDDADVAEQIIRLIEHPQTAREMAAAAARTCDAYDAAVVRERWRAVYRSVVSSRAASNVPAMTRVSKS